MAWVAFRHDLMLLWFRDLMNVTKKATIHRPNVSTLLSGAFIRGDLTTATRGPFLCSLISCPFFWWGVNGCQVVSRHHRYLRSVGGNDIPGFQTKALVAMLISIDYFRIIPSSCMVSQACVLPQSWIFFFAKEESFLMMLFQMCTKLTFGLSDILVITVIT